MKVAAGLLQYRATLFAPVAGPAPNGDPATTYAAAGTVWCGIVSVKPSATEAESQRAATADVQLLMRLGTLTKTLTAAWRVVFQGTTYLVVGIDAEPRDGSLLLYLRGHQA